ncbi:hypothetical protein HF896_01260 [Alicycliphilus denitrificans]|uniref:Uncharacterized protein n=1 Tax=Alicycliphilus denitrificans TaxID=179636 RepID=A0A858ZPB9_9BURK|nr:hypothetical protein HF896_01260 [Alicycliphilus denitrificans]
MPLAQTSSRMPRCALLAALVVGAALGVYFQLPAMTYYWGQSLRQEAQLRPVSLWLPAYQATIQGRPLRGVEKNLSGLTFNNGTGTLFASTNSPAQIVELSVEGEVLRIIRVSGAQDTEGIAHVEGGRFMLSGGAPQRAVCRGHRAGQPRSPGPRVGAAAAGHAAQQPGGGDRVVGRIRAAPAGGPGKVAAAAAEPAGQPPGGAHMAPAGLGGAVHQ